MDELIENIKNKTVYIFEAEEVKIKSVSTITEEKTQESKLSVGYEKIKDGLKYYFTNPIVNKKDEKEMVEIVDIFFKKK